MREIIFRGKRTDNGEWAYGSLVIAAGMTFISVFGVVSPLHVDCETVGQSTGLIDKHGDRKWEGDIFIWDDRLYVIEFDENALAWYATAYFDPDYSISLSEFYADEIGVIGNIHDNPELL